MFVFTGIFSFLLFQSRFFGKFDPQHNRGSRSTLKEGQVIQKESTAYSFVGHQATEKSATRSGTFVDDSNVSEQTMKTV